MIDLESRLADLGDALDLDEGDELVSAVVARISDPAGDHRTGGLPIDRRRGPASRSRRSRAVWLRVAAVAVIASAALLALPAPRQAIADWFGLDGVEIHREPGLVVPPGAPALDGEQSGGEGTVVEVDGTDVLVDEIDISTIDGRLDDALIGKTLPDGTGIRRVDVDGRPGLWIDGEPHVVTYRSRNGEAVSERFAGNTLLWQDGDTIRRVEGFETVDAALAFAEGT